MAVKVKFFHFRFFLTFKRGKWGVGFFKKSFFMNFFMVCNSF